MDSETQNPEGNPVVQTQPVPEQTATTPIVEPKAEGQTFMSKALSFVWDIAETFLISLAIFILIYNFALQPYRVKGASMEPNFYNKEFIYWNYYFLMYNIKNESY